MSTADAAAARSLDREWWLLTLAFLVRPRALFVALRDDSDEAVGARQEPVTALVLLGGIAAVLASGTAGHLLDDPPYRDPLLIAIWAFIAGAIYGIASYWAVGVCLHAGQRAAGGSARYRQSRHLLAFAAAPLVVWLVSVWPVRLALYGEDLFRRGGSDGHTSRIVFGAIGGLFVLWCLALLVYGVRTVYSWGWRQAAVAVSLAIAVLAAFGIAVALL